MKKLGENLNLCSNFWMFHRISFQKGDINDIYNQRGMLHTYDDIIKLIDNALKKGKKFGSIKQALKNKHIIHLIFDDGYKEHLAIARKIKKKYNFFRDQITFSINVRNSFYAKKLSMDLIYELIETNELYRIDDVLNKKLSSIKCIKDEIFKSTQYIASLNMLNVNLRNTYLCKSEIIKLSKLFSIASHCINHYYLTSLNEKNILYEIKTSKNFLEKIINAPIETICYPDGKNNKQVREISKKCNYKYGLSISQGIDEYEIGRKIQRL